MSKVSPIKPGAEVAQPPAETKWWQRLFSWLRTGRPRSEFDDNTLQARVRAQAEQQGINRDNVDQFKDDLNSFLAGQRGNQFPIWMSMWGNAQEKLSPKQWAAFQYRDAFQKYKKTKPPKPQNITKEEIARLERAAPHGALQIARLERAAPDGALRF